MPISVIANVAGFKCSMTALSKEIGQLNTLLASKTRDFSVVDLSKINPGKHLANIVVITESTSSILYDLQHQDAIEKRLLVDVEKILGELIYIKGEATLRSAFKRTKKIGESLAEIMPEIEKLKE